MANELDPTINVGKRLAEAAREVGLDMKQFFVVPDLDGDHHRVTGVFLLDEDNPQGTLPQREANPEFDQLVKDQMRFEQEQRADEARKELESLQEDLRDPKKGLGLDDDD